MKRSWAVLIVLVAFAVGAVAQQSPAEQSSPPAAPNAKAPVNPPPSGTKVTKHEMDTIVQPVPKPVKITPQVIRNSQTALKERGYYAGPVDGIYGPATRAAVAKFQADQGLVQTGRLDLNTMVKLNVGGVQALEAAPADVGRGGKAFGHNMKQGHPVAASKALGKGTLSSGKNVAKGTESLTKRGIEKVGSGLSKIGSDLKGTVNGGSTNPQKSAENPPPQSPQPPPPPAQPTPPPQR